MAFASHVFTLSDLAAGARKSIASGGFGFQVVPESGSLRGTYPLKLIIESSHGFSTFFVASPGYVHCPEGFHSIKVEALAANAAGTWYINVGNALHDSIDVASPPPNPVLDYPSAMGGGGGTVTMSAGLGPSGATTQLHNSAANTPVAVGDGVSIANANSFYAIVTAASAINAGVGKVRFWRFNLADNAWTLIDNVYYVPITGGLLRLQFAEEVLKVVKAGDRLYPECLSMTNTGVGVFTARLAVNVG